MFLQIFKAQNIFEIKLVEVGNYNSTNQAPQYLKWLLKRIFLTLKKCQAKFKKIRARTLKVSSCNFVRSCKFDSYPQELTLNVKEFYNLFFIYIKLIWIMKLGIYCEVCTKYFVYMKCNLIRVLNIYLICWK